MCGVWVVSGGVRGVAAMAWWVVVGVTRLAGVDVSFHEIVKVLYAAAVLSGVTGVLNAGWTRIRRITVRLENLPGAWRGRKGGLISDLHLGHVRKSGVLPRIVAEASREK